jgi:protein kinase A
MASTSFSKPLYSKSQTQLQPQSQPHSSSQRSSSAQRCYTQSIPHHNSFPRSASHPTSPGHTRQDERNFIAHHDERREIVLPERIEHDPVSRKLGFSSKKLKIDDFELMKTLGTGISCAVRLVGKLRLKSPTGTFARVWLTRLANPRHEDRNKVFALKVLRKVDGMGSIRNAHNVLLTSRSHQA